QPLIAKLPQTVSLVRNTFEIPGRIPRILHSKSEYDIKIEIIRHRLRTCLAGKLLSLFYRTSPLQGLFAPIQSRIEYSRPNAATKPSVRNTPRVEVYTAYSWYPPSPGQEQ